MEEIIQHFESLNELEKKHILKSSTLKEDYIEEISQIFTHIPFDQINLTIDKLCAKDNKDIEMVFELRDAQRNINQVLWDDGSPYNQRIQRGELMGDFIYFLERDNGLSKTELLRNCKKDNGKWRPIADYILSYMIGNRILIKMGCKYYLSNQLMTQETTFHRMVYDYICDGPHSISAILNKVGYRNPKGKRKLLEVLKIMEEEDLIFKKGNYWSILSNN